MKRIQRVLDHLLKPEQRPSNGTLTKSSSTPKKVVTMSGTTDSSSTSPNPIPPAQPQPPDPVTILPLKDISSMLPQNITVSEPQHVFIAVQDVQGGSTHGFLHLPDTPSITSPSRTAVILLSGVYGGVVGPSSIYLSLATKLVAVPTSPLPSLRLDFRHPGHVNLCIADTEAAMTYLQEHHQIDSFVLVGWSFGGAPVFTIAGRDKRVIGVATIASQPASALKGAYESGKKNLPVLLLHGTDDRILNVSCAKELHGAYKVGFKERLREQTGGNVEAETQGRVEMVLFNGYDHSLSQDAVKSEKLLAEFIIRCVDGDIGGKDGEEVVTSEIIGTREQRIEIMQKAGDAESRDQPSS